MMEQQTKTGTSQTETTPSKWPKQNDFTQDTDDNQLTIVTKSSASNSTDIDMRVSEALPNQEPPERGTPVHNFVLSSTKDCSLVPDKNLELVIACSKSSRTTEVWNKSLQEDYAAQIREWSLLGHLICSERILEKTLESDIFCLLECERF